MTDAMPKSTTLNSEIARIEADPVERASLGAAALANAVGALMEQAIEGSGLSKQEIASRMGVTPARISQLVGGDGNVRIATLARLLEATDFEVTVVARSRHDDQELVVPRRSRPRRSGGTRQPDLSCVQTPAEFYEPMRRTA